MDTEADNANVPKNEDSDLQLGMGEDEGAPERFGGGRVMDSGSI